MHRNISHISVVVVLLYHISFLVDADVMTDLSDECRSERNLSFFLTTGYGKRDGFVGMIAQVEGISCTIKFLASKGTSIIFVFELLDWNYKHEPCGKVSNNVTVRTNDLTLNVCQRLSRIKSNVIRFISNGSVDVTLVADDNLDTVKITATAVRDAGKGVCNMHGEINCIFSEHLYCMSDQFLCDSHINCGVRAAYDESGSNCAAYNQITPWIIITGIQIVFITFILLVSILRKWLPHKKGTFIYKKDETLTEKDRSKSQKLFTVKMKILTDPVGGPNVENIHLPPLVEMGQSTVFRPKVSLRKFWRSTRRMKRNE